MNTLFFILTLTTFSPDAALCPSQTFEKADIAMDTLTSWRAVDDFYTRYRNCDDGYILEGTSDRIARLLVDEWYRLEELSPLIKVRPPLADYILSHISTHTDKEDLEKLQFLSSSQCKIANQKFCERLHFATVLALKEQFNEGKEPPDKDKRIGPDNYQPMSLDAV